MPASHRHGDALLQLRERLAGRHTLGEQRSVHRRAVMSDRPPHDDTPVFLHPFQGAARAKSQFPPHGGRHRNLTLGGELASYVVHASEVKTITTGNATIPATDQIGCTPAVSSTSSQHVISARSCGETAPR